MTSGQNPSISYLDEQTKNEKNNKYIYKRRKTHRYQQLNINCYVYICIVTFYLFLFIDFIILCAII